MAFFGTAALLGLDGLGVGRSGRVSGVVGAVVPTIPPGPFRPAKLRACVQKSWRAFEGIGPPHDYSSVQVKVTSYTVPVAMAPPFWFRQSIWATPRSTSACSLRCPKSQTSTTGTLPAAAVVLTSWYFVWRTVPTEVPTVGETAYDTSAAPAAGLLLSCATAVAVVGVPALFAVLRLISSSSAWASAVAAPTTSMRVTRTTLFGAPA